MKQCDIEKNLLWVTHNEDKVILNHYDCGDIGCGVDKYEIKLCPICGFQPERSKREDLDSRDENGRIEKKCMRDKCHQPIWVREYMQYDIDRPLFCPDCWEQVYAYIKVINESRKDSSWEDIKQEVIKSIFSKS